SHIEVVHRPYREPSLSSPSQSCRFLFPSIRRSRQERGPPCPREPPHLPYAQTGLSALLESWGSSRAYGYQNFLQRAISRGSLRLNRLQLFHNLRDGPILLAFARMDVAAGRDVEIVLRNFLAVHDARVFVHFLPS